MKLIVTRICAIFLYFISTAWAAGVDSVVAVRTYAPVEQVYAGGEAALTIELEIARSYHINSNRPMQDYLIPTSVEFDPAQGVIFDEAVFPEAQIKKLPVSDTPMSVYERTVKITAAMRLAEDFSQKEAIVHGRVRSQACDRNSCLPPVWTPFSVVVPVVAASVRPPEPVLTEAVSAQAENPDESMDDASETGYYRRGLFLNLVLAFLGGLALNLTPCVYPLIPITLAWFGGQTRGDKKSLIVHAGVYVFGMAVTYSILGVAAALTGNLFGATLQYPAVLSGVALVMVLFALGMFDVYELRMPAFLTSMIGAPRTGLTGTLLMGLTVGIVAAPCIGPFVLGLLTYVGERGSVLAGFLLFFALALGLGAPFLVLGIFSGSIHRLPRSGDWMIWVRKVFGFVLFGMAWYFLRSLLSPLTWTLGLAFLMLIGGIYLAWIASVTGAGKVFTVFRNIVGGLFFASALYVTVTGIETVLNQKTFAPAVESSRESVVWESYSRESLVKAREERRPVFIDFYADWCEPCHELDAKTYSNPEVVRLARRFVMLKADLTAGDDPAVKALMEKYRIRGVPTLVFLRPDGGEMTSLRGTGFVTAGTFLDKMTRALRAADEPSQLINDKNF
ncbi:MAG: thioredoxin family protein [Acidobacteria bacterium]|nr:thioredoxin family protein [Acidobacteriota bacterium]